MIQEARLKKSANTATALGFISAIGAIGGFFIPNAFSLSIALSGTPINAMKAFSLLYCCGLITWFVYGKELNKQNVTINAYAYGAVKWQSF